ncbi:MAG: UDP-N-acetylmuramate dehydrogenase [Bacteroidia bacterium]|nr:UDP-N-acetylmuramate dehydrogenase [Bacteroidia bacterium]MCO5253905.1 UDP-N-acetylmuramate dehydrogenase [Bacteroidota bacterium]
MQILENVSLKPYQTFGLDVNAKALTIITSQEYFWRIWTNPSFKNQNKLILGGGSNVLFTSDYDGLVIVNQIKGREIVKETQEHVWIKFKSGESWHESVCWMLEQGWSGVENMSLIPGTIGAAPMQNIGAYGVELKDIFDSLEAIDLSNGNIVTFRSAECNFGYRDSIFKTTHKNQYFISAVTLKVNKQPHYHIEYGDIKATLSEMQITESQISPMNVSKAVIKIRQSKLPDPRELGNSGSFFKNPSIPTAQFESLQKNHPDIKGYPSGAGMTKVPAGWLIEQTGWKGKRIGNCGSHAKQALVLVNYGGAHGSEIYQLAQQIQQSVLDTFGISITPEVNIY